MSTTGLLMEPDNIISQADQSLVSLRQLARKHAPILCFASNHNFLPGNVEWYIDKCWLVNSTANSRIVAKNNLRHIDDGAAYHLQLKEGVNLESYKVVPKSYVHVKRTTKNYTDLQYWFLFMQSNATRATLRWMIDDIKGHESIMDLYPLGTLEGTWEHLTVRINDRTGEPEAYYFPELHGGSWIKTSEVKRLRSQVIVYVSSNSNGFYPDKSVRLSNSLSFDLHSSRLEFSQEHTFGDAKSCDFSLFSELVSVTELPEFAPSALSWLNYNHYWGQPKPDYLSQHKLKQILYASLGNKFEFLLSRDIVNELSATLVLQTTQRQQLKSVSPRFQEAWDKVEE